MSGFRLILTEKPSVARDLAQALGTFARRSGFLEQPGTRIAWCLGHLVELAEPGDYRAEWKRWRLRDLPMLPERFHLRPRAAKQDRGALEQWQVVRSLLADPTLEEVVNACDAGREGELIFAYAYQLSGCTRPVRRLWIRSLTAQAIADGFAALRDGAALAPLEAAARCRSEADWLVGLNATRALTLRNQELGGRGQLSLGRVQTPTLAMLVDREREIRDFVPRAFFQVKLTLEAPAGRWEALWRRGQQDRFDDEPDALRILALTLGKTGAVTKVERKQKREPPPLLYDLTTLQREANRRYGMSAQRTLDLAQALYEREKLITYPRTDSRHVSSDQKDALRAAVGALAFGPYQGSAEAILAAWPPKWTARVIDDAEASDHHAIIPTAVDPRECRLVADEKRVYDLVARRLLAVFSPDAVFAQANVEADIAGETFAAKGRIRLEAGWQAIDPPASTSAEIELPPVAVGDPAVAVEGEVKEGRTKPPARFNDGSLLAAMERAGEDLEEAELRRAMKGSGLGTPATRAAIIEKLLDRGFAARDGKHLVPTALGESLIVGLPDGSLRSARLTGAWEARLSEIALGRDSRTAFMRDIEAFTAEVVAAIAAHTLLSPIVAPGSHFPPVEATGPAIGTCPRCQGEVVPTARGYGCMGGCGLLIWAEIAGRTVSPKMVKALVEHGRTAVVKGFTSRAGATFAASLVLEPDGHVGFAFPEGEALGACPACGSPVSRRGKAYGCARGRECAFVVFALMSGRAIEEDTVRELLATGTTGYLEGFTSRQGTAFGGRLRWTGERVIVEPCDPRELEAPAGACPRCGKDVRFREQRWRCDACDLSLPRAVMDRALAHADIAALLAHGRTPRLHGFRQKGGAYCKAALVLGPEGHIVVDFARPADEPAMDPDAAQPNAPTETDSAPSNGRGHALGTSIECPACIDRGSTDPGHMIAGNAAWGCSRWREGCPLVIPFVVAGRPLAIEELRRALGKHRATVYLAGFHDDAGIPRTRGCRLVIDPTAEQGWRLEEKARSSRR